MGNTTLERPREILPKGEGMVSGSREIFLRLRGFSGVDLGSSRSSVFSRGSLVDDFEFSLRGSSDLDVGGFDFDFFLPEREVLPLLRLRLKGRPAAST